ncbi:hypothetical protein AAFF_G00320100 [Aldrovandia affinis]|uniref:Immunoglobulin V-set domain-containing protein n=1 Tax=Aldrovandia affinis TaxID=143900 RepID=A0AAD7WQH2_9TELE|nr:hypothetical protein AAFF_G00320100 [Aldrovandia affinis]
MEGDVSLTIINVTENDSGIYGCRVEIPGLFNDLKQIFNLIIRKDHSSTQRRTNWFHWIFNTDKGAKQKRRRQWSSTLCYHSWDWAHFGGIAYIHDATEAVPEEQMQKCSLGSQRP